MTPGPWKTHVFEPETGKQHFVTAGLQDQIPIAKTGRWDLASAADARAIAALPQLVAACKVVAQIADWNPDKSGRPNAQDFKDALMELRDQARAALKAAGVE